MHSSNITNSARNKTSLNDRINPLANITNNMNISNKLSQNNSAYISPNLISKNYQNINPRGSTSISFGGPMNNYRVSQENSGHIGNNAKLLNDAQNNMMNFETSNLAIRKNNGHFNNNTYAMNSNVLGTNKNYMNLMNNPKSSDRFLGDFNNRLNDIMLRSQNM